MKAATAWLALRSRNSRRGAALLCLALFLVLQVFAASSELHNSLHADSTAPGHSCVITLLAHGQLNAPEVSVGCVLAVLGLVFALPQLQAAAVRSFDYRFAPTRGPPRA